MSLVSGECSICGELVYSWYQVGSKKLKYGHLYSLSSANHNKEYDHEARVFTFNDYLKELENELKR